MGMSLSAKLSESRCFRDSWLWHYVSDKGLGLSAQIDIIIDVFDEFSEQFYGVIKVI